MELMILGTELENKAFELDDKLSKMDKNEMMKFFMRLQSASEGFQNLIATNSIDYAC